MAPVLGSALASLAAGASLSLRHTGGLRRDLVTSTNRRAPFGPAGRFDAMMAPFRALLSHRGPRMMLAVALIFSITSNLDKLGVERSSPVFWSLAVSVMITLILTPTLL